MKNKANKLNEFYNVSVERILQVLEDATVRVSSKPDAAYIDDSHLMAEVINEVVANELDSLQHLCEYAASFFVDTDSNTHIIKKSYYDHKKKLSLPMDIETSSIEDLRKQVGVLVEKLLKMNFEECTKKICVLYRNLLPSFWC